MGEVGRTNAEAGRLLMVLDPIHVSVVIGSEDKGTKEGMIGKGGKDDMRKRSVRTAS